MAKVIVGARLWRRAVKAGIEAAPLVAQPHAMGRERVQFQLLRSRRADAACHVGAEVRSSSFEFGHQRVCLGLEMFEPAANQFQGDLVVGGDLRQAGPTHDVAPRLAHHAGALVPRPCRASLATQWVGRVVSPSP
jgi:hypothetical protein